MAIKLNKPFSEEERMDFVVRFNHCQGLSIHEGAEALYALEPNEILVNGLPQLDPNWQEKQSQLESARLAQLSLTKREVFLAIYKYSGILPEQIREKITSKEALIEFDYANEYYRGNPLIDSIGSSLGYTKDLLDYLFEHKEFPPIKEEVSSGDMEVIDD